MQPIRVLVADDSAVLRTALCALLETEPDLCVAGQADSGEAAVAAALELRPDVVLMDLSMPGCGGLEATRSITATTAARVLVLSMHPEEVGLLPSLRAGASGYLAKTASPDELLGTIRNVARGDVVLSSAGAWALVGAVARARTTARTGRSARRPPGPPGNHPDSAG